MASSRASLVFSLLAALLPVAPAPAQELDYQPLRRHVPKIVASAARGETDTGSGIVVGRSPEKDLLVILTAMHVVEEAEKVEVVFYDRRFKSFPGRVFHRVNTDLDMAVVLVDLKPGETLLTDLPTLDIARLERLKEGDGVVAIGHPLSSEWRISFDNTIEELTDRDDDRKLHITLGSIERGSSGGPIFDARGALVGMVTSIHPIHAVAVKIESAMKVLENWGFKPTLVRLPELLGTVVARSDPPGAEVFLDGVRAGVTAVEPVTIEDVSPGAHEVELRKEGFEPWREQFDLAAGATYPVQGKLRPTVKGMFLVVLESGPGGLDPGIDVAEASLLDGLVRRGFSVVDRSQTARIRGNESHMEAVRQEDAVRLAAIAQEHDAEVIVVGRLESEARAAMGNFFSGSAVLALKSYRAGTAEYLAAQTLQVPGGGVQIRWEPSEMLARTAASRAVAELAAQAVIDQVVPKLGLELVAVAGPGPGEALPPAGSELVIVVMGPTLAECQQVQALLEGRFGARAVKVRQLVRDERLVLGVDFEGDTVALGYELDDTRVGQRKLRLSQAEPMRLTLRLEG